MNIATAQYHILYKPWWLPLCQHSTSGSPPLHTPQEDTMSTGWTIVSAPKRLFLAPNGSRRFFTFLHQNYFFSAPNSFFFHTKTIFFAPNYFCKLIRFCTKFILILHQIFCKLGQNYIDFAPNISWNFSGLAPNISRFCTNLSQISTKCVDAIQNKSSITTLLHQISLIFQIWPPVSQFC